ncbi:MAG: HD-GYP domain-containing protein, partial [Phycisphaerales bacterium]|nr:HD-GYP domain-containing protein [Phycisphaerales bacterium]
MESPTEQRNGKSGAHWAPRVWAGRAVQALVVLGPLSLSLLAAWMLGRAIPTPSTIAVAILRWVGIALLSTVVLVATDRVFRRLLPLATLLKLALSFPDSAPSRFRIALRTGTTKQLRHRIESARSGRFGDTPAEAAELVLELVAALSMHDRLTRGHSERVRAYAQMIGEEMGMEGKDLDRLRWAGLLHDIGKLMIPTEILNKPGKLTDDEFGIIKLHPEYGEKMVAPLTPWLGEAARAVWEHHERWDGGGYPRGIAGGDIAQAARIVSVADTYDVITSVRSYKPRTSAKEARAELARCSGTQFDPTVVRAFLNISVYPIGRVTAPASWATQVAL